ncbi:hypothetical protein ACSVC9_05520 [Clostridium sp. LBM24168]
MWKTSLFELTEGNVEVRNKMNVKNTFKINEINSMKVGLKYRNALILIHGEKIYVENITIPKIRKKYIYGLIEDRLKNKFKDIDNMMFSYKIWQKSRFSLSMTVLCINRNYRDLIKKFSENRINVKGMIPVQIYALNKYKDIINKEKYIFVVYFEVKTYFIACYKNKIIFNELFKIKSKSEFMECIDEFNLRLNVLVPNIKFYDIEFVNLPCKDILEDLRRNYSCNDLGEMTI